MAHSNIKSYYDILHFTWYYAIYTNVYMCICVLRNYREYSGSQCLPIFGNIWFKMNFRRVVKCVISTLQKYDLMKFQISLKCGLVNFILFFLTNIWILHILELDWIAPNLLGFKKLHLKLKFPNRVNNFRTTEKPDTKGHL